MSNLYRGPSRDASYQVSVHLAKWLQRRRFFRNQPIFIEDLPRMLPTKFRFIWPSGFRRDFLDINQSETRIAFGGHVC